MSRAIVIRGPAGIGKTATAIALAEILYGELISLDRIRQQNGLVRYLTYFAPYQVETTVAQLAAEQAKVHLVAQKPVVIEGVFLSQSVLNTLARSLGNFPMEVVNVKASWETVCSRNKGRPPENYVPEDKLERLFQLDAQIRTGVCIQTDKMNRQEMVDAILQSINHT
jgi:shikimate kinase